MLTPLHGSAPGGGGIPTEIRDADTDTGIRSEQAADEDKIRLRVGGTQRGLWQTASPHITLTGDSHITGLVGLGIAPVAAIALNVNISGTFSSGNVNVIQAQPTGFTASGNTMAITGVIGAPAGTVGSSTTGQTWDGLNYSLLLTGGASATVARLAGAILRTGLLSFTGTLTDMYGAWFQAPFMAAASSTVTLSTGLRIGDIGSSNRIVDAYGLRIDDLTANTGFRRIIEAGGTIGSLPNLRVEANAPTAPGADKGRSRVLATFAEGATPTFALRRFEWKDYSTLAAGDRVVVAV